MHYNPGLDCTGIGIEISIGLADLVIPAKAGILGSRGMLWIPAFAGMTLWAEGFRQESDTE